MVRRIPLFYLFFIAITSSISFAQYQKVNSSGLDVYYRIFGEGEPILIIGGGPGDVSDRYVSLCNLLSTNYKCILIEQRGCGKSTPAPFDSTTISVDLTLGDFEALRKELGYEKWNVLGFSYGGYLASIYSHFFPSSIKSLILLGSAGLNLKAFRYFRDNIISRMQSTDIDLMEFWSDSARVETNPQHAITETIRAMMPGYFYDKKKALIISQAIKDSDFNFDLGDFIWGDIIRRNLDLAEMPVQFNGPVLILHGRQDPLGDSIAIEINNYFKKSKLVFIERAGHYSWIEQPDKILNSIKEFITTKD